MKPRSVRTSGAALAAALALGAVSSLAVLPAHAQGTPSPSDKATARILGTEGLRLAEAGDCEAAVEKLERAEALYHAPTTLGRLGECQVQLGLLVAGTENLQRVVREPLPPNASPAFRAAKARAKQVLDEALPKIAMLVVHVEPSRPDAEYVVKVDGAVVPDAILGAKRPTDPGERVVEASGPHCETVSERVRLQEGETATLRLKLSCKAPPAPPPEPPAKPSPGAAGQNGATTPATPPPADNTLAYVALGVGGAGLAVGSIFGLMAMSEKSNLDDACDGERRCPSSAQSNLDNLDRDALVSNIGFGVGIVGVGVGTALILTSGGGAPEQADEGVAKPAPSLRPWLGIGSAGVTGSF